MKLPKVPLQGSCFSVTIAQANVIQSLVTTRMLVRSVQIIPGTAVGTVTMSLGPSPLFPSLSINVGPDEWIDLANIRIKSTAANDTVLVQTTYAP